MANNRELQKLLKDLELLHEEQKKKVVAEIDKLKEIEADYAQVQKVLEERLVK